MVNPTGRFERLDVEIDPEHADPLPEHVKTEYFRDTTRSVITRNDSPDVGFECSLNPYRGCEHGCVYCYARPTHEYLGLSLGLDFESRIFVKQNAPELLRHELSRPHWKPETLVLSGVTDPYQPVERRLKITRGCLEVLAEFRNPVGIITKSDLVTRDADVLDHALLIHRIEAVVHFAAFAFVGESVTDPARYYQNNVATTISVIQAMEEAGVERFVFSSTCAVYGDPDVIPITEDENPRARARLRMA